MQAPSDELLVIYNYKIIRIVGGPSLVNKCVNTVCKHGYDIIRILIGYSLLDARFD